MVFLKKTFKKQRGLLLCLYLVMSASYSKSQKQEPIAPIPLKIELPQEKVSLGEKLFHDPILSKNNKISCASCHSLSQGGVDGKKFSTGINNAKGDINTPTVWNSRFNFFQFWDGRAKNLEDQAEGPLTHPKEMGSSWSGILKKLKANKEYRKRFSQIYKDGITPKNVKNAIAIFEESLITPNSKFDRYLRGDSQALTKKELEGYNLFKVYGCISCHQGVNVGGNMFQKFGILENYFKKRGKIKKSDYGRFNVTGKEEDKHKFKVPTLRNIELTAPYFHDGSAKTLEQAVEVMSVYQLGRSLKKKDIDRIVLFLKSLTGEYKGKKLNEL